MTPVIDPWLLILETSGRVGRVALAKGNALRQARTLDEARRHARDLAPTVAEVLRQEGITARDLHGVIVSHGPGSYTGLRVGIMSAKTLCYAVGCPLIAVETFAAIAWQAPATVARLHVIADAQQDKLYARLYERETKQELLRPVTPLRIQPWTEWLREVRAGDGISGPGITPNEHRLPAGGVVMAMEQREARVESLLWIGLSRWQARNVDDVWSVEPLYLRASSAEEKWPGR
ncbi:MAG: tRNA (adenosine(37)-N6)-threonylcarbamoyltransferase complex dimerization subunit type 1 TsaB [Gemmataceae bacterium]